MYKWWFSLAAVFVSLQATGQQIQWASRVQGYSSQAGYQANSAKQVLGEPNKYPALGNSPVAWAPSFEDAAEERYIKVGFQKPMTIQQVMIAETNQKGAVQAVYLFDRNQKGSLVYEAPKEEGIEEGSGGMLSITFKETRYPVYSVKVVLKNSDSWSSHQIDAIGISNSTEPWVPMVAVTEKFKAEGQANPLPTSVNSSYAEILPRLDPKSDRLYFCRKNHPENFGFKPNDDIWYVDRESDGSWGLPKNMGWPLNDENHNYVCTVSEDGELLTLGNGYRFDRKPLPGVSQTIKTGSDWVEPLNLKIEGLSILNLNAEYYLSSNRKVLILAMESWDSQGGKDLYVSFSKDMVHFSKPVSMGHTINSAGREMAPFLSEDGMHLFFSSDGFPGYGSQDIFVSERLDETYTAWSTPENLGPQVNSAAWDSYFYYHSKTGQAFFSSNRSDPSNEDLYYLKLIKQTPQRDLAQESIVALAGMNTLGGVAELERAEAAAGQRLIAEAEAQAARDAPVPSLILLGAVFDQNSKELIHATLDFTLNGGEMTDSRIKTGQNEYKMSVEAGRKYHVEISAPGYFSEKVSFTAEESAKGQMRRDFELIPIREGQTISLDNIYFDVNSAVLQQQSYASLDRWVDLLQQEPGVMIQVQGHTNNRCSPRFCLELSQKRAKAVSDYMQSNGITEQRLRFRGFGSEIPVADNEQEDGRARNQRVELKILKVN